MTEHPAAAGDDQHEHPVPHGHDHDEHHGPGGAHDHEAGLADLLDLDAEVLGSYLDQLVEWAGQLVSGAPRVVVDVGAGTGTGSLALARRFPSAHVVALDRSPAMLDRVATAADQHGLTGRLRVVPADLDQAWPDIGPVDLAWASSALHELADPDRVFRDLHAAMRPGGLLVVVELDALPRFLPDDLGHGRPGLEARCHQALVEAGWNAHPDWRPHLQRAGFDVLEQRTVLAEPAAGDAAPAAGRVAEYAAAHLRRIRSAVHGRLDEGDLASLDLLLSGDAPHGLRRRIDLRASSSRTAWAARRT